MEKVLMMIKKIYLHIPVRLLNFFAPLYYILPERIRYGKVYVETKKYKS